jgi:dihydroxyacetone kinase
MADGAVLGDVTDAIASADDEHADTRHGIAGSVVVFKAVGAAVARGASLDVLERIARLANDRTRTIGVAFAGCTLPGRTQPLFRVAPGSMAIGLGIHGEPGIQTIERRPARELARTLVAALVEQARRRGDTSGGRTGAAGRARLGR